MNSSGSNMTVDVYGKEAAVGAGEIFKLKD
jgi:hypothetical protein